jgi:cbb3-type cytochrome oxidase cytochrome c subunit
LVNSSGEVLDNQGKYVEVVGKFVLRTDDPEEMIQDIILDVNGKTVYVDEQCVRPV